MFLKTLRNAFFTGLIILFPLGVTLLFAQFLVKKIGAPLSNIFFFYVDVSVRAFPWVHILLDIISTLLVICIITILGFISRYFFGRMLLAAAEKVVTAVPFIRQVYMTTKQVINTFAEQKKAMFQRCVLVEFPRAGVYSFGFVTSVNKSEIHTKIAESTINVFIPTTPNPTSGFLIFIPKEQAIELSMSIADGMKLVISGGTLVPSEMKPR